jgi:alcohol dehydrogenase class IV
MAHSDAELRKFVAPEFVFGTGALSLAGRYAVNLGAHKVLVVTGRNVVRSGWTDKVIKCLTDEGLLYSVFSGITPNPKAEEVMAGANVYREEHCDVIVAVGGGSSIDCAKGIGIVSTNRKNILEFKGVDQIPVPGPPLICVPTTAGSSADISQFAVITDTQAKIKISIISKALVPDVALIDPATTATMPRDLTVHTGIDALTHAIEAYVSNASSPITDLFAFESIRLICSYLPLVFKEPDNITLRSQVMLGSLDAGMAFSNASLGLTHAMAHSLGGFLDLPHGESDAILLGNVIEFNYDVVPERYNAIGEAMGLDLKGMDRAKKKSVVVGRIREFEQILGANETLRDIGVRREDIPELAKKAAQDVCIVTNPRPASLKDIEAIYEKSL